MPDLNWRNENMREALKAMIKWWIDLGVDGFRVDASNHLEKNWDFPDAKPGYEHFSSLPKHHDYLEELGKELFKPHDLMVIGEAGGATKKEALMYAGYDSNEFNMLIQFEHCWVDCDPTNTLTPGKWAKGNVDVTRIKQSFNHWIEIFKDKGWNTIYWHNHDQPRIVSHYGNDSLVYREKSAKMLALTLYLLPGTPIVYYGEEIGMTNVDYMHLNDFRDVEVFTEYENFIRNGASHEIAMQALRDRARDNARSPMQWDNTLNGGFSEFTPWIPTNHNSEFINVKHQLEDKDSILNLYKTLLHLRKEEALAHGDLTFIDIDHPDTFNYRIIAKNHTYLVLANFKEKALIQIMPDDMSDYTLYLTNDQLEKAIANDAHFGPYEARIYRKRNK
jgi:glycosidase